MSTQLARRQDKRRAGTEVTPESLIRDTHRMLDVAGFVRSHSWVTRTVRTYCKSVAVSGFPFGRYLQSQVDLNAQQRAEVLACSDLRYLLDYADPTGESAVRNILRGGPDGS